MARSINTIDSTLLHTRRKFISELRPDLWLDASGVSLAGARTCVAAQSQQFAFTTSPDPGTNDIWCSVFVKPTTIGANQYIVFSGAAGTAGWRLMILAAGTVYARLAGSANKDITSTTVLSAGQWYHIVYAADRDGNQTLAVNNVSAATPVDVSALVADDITYALGSSIGGITGSYLNATFTQLRIGIGSLPTAAEITELYSGGNGIRYSHLSAALAAKLTHSYECDESSGNLIDVVGANTGTAANSPGSSEGPSQAFTRVASEASKLGSLGPFAPVTVAGSGLLVPGYQRTQPVIECDSGDYSKAAAAQLTGTTGYVAAIVRPTGSGAMVVYSQADEASANRFLQLGVSAAGTIHYKWQNGGTADELSGTTVLTNRFHLLEWSSDGDTITAKVDGVAETLTAASGDNNGNWFGDVTGADNSIVGAIETSGGVSGNFVGQRAELIAFDDVVFVTAPTMILRGFAARKYNTPTAREIDEGDYPSALRFYTLTNWGTSGTGVTEELDETNTFAVHGSLKATTTSATAQVAKTGLSLDLTGKAVAVRFYFHDDPTLTSGVSMRLLTSTGNYFNYTFSEVVQGWNYYVVPQAKFVVTGTPDWSNITVVYFFASNSGNTFSISYDLLAIGYNGPCKAVLTCDAAYINQYTNAFPICQSLGIPMSMFLVGANIGLSADYCTLANLKEMYAAGWDMACRSPAATGSMVGMAEADAKAQFAAIRNQVCALGFTRSADFLGWPNSAENSDLRTWARDYFRMARSGRTYWRQHCPIESEANMSLGSASMDAYTLQNFTDALDEGILCGGLFIRHVHYTEPIDWQGMMEYVAEKRDAGEIEVMTISQYWDWVAHQKHPSGWYTKLA